jgi:aspartate-semialdehyde dehydrogenase
MGKEVKSSLEASPLAGSEVGLLDSKEHEGMITEYRGEARFISAVNKESFIRSDVIFLCCSRGEAKRYIAFPRKRKSFVIDFSMMSREDYAAPLINCSINMQDIKKHQGIVASPHPITMMLSNLFSPLDQVFGIQNASVNVFSPVSILGEEAIEELYQQTINLLNFKEMPKEIFKNQLVFNVIPDFAEKRASKENSLERKITEEVPAILGWKSKKLTIRIILVPVFHCHSFSLHLTFRKDLKAVDIVKELENTKGVRWIPQGEAAPTPVSVAGRQEIHLSNLQEDGLSAKGFWLWCVSDHLLSGCASNAIKLAEYLVSEKMTH